MIAIVSVMYGGWEKGGGERSGMPLDNVRRGLVPVQDFHLQPRAAALCALSIHTRSLSMFVQKIASRL